LQADKVGKAGDRGGSFSGRPHGRLPVHASRLASTLKSWRAESGATANGPAPDPPRSPTSKWWCCRRRPKHRSG